MKKLNNDKLDQAIKLAWGKPSVYTYRSTANRKSKVDITVRFPKSIAKKTVSQLAKDLGLISKRYDPKSKIQSGCNKIYISFSREETKEEELTRLKAIKKVKDRKCRQAEKRAKSLANQHKDRVAREKITLKNFIEKYPKVARSHIK